MKRTLAFILSVVIVLGCFPIMAAADDNDSEVKRYTVLVLDTSNSASFLGSNNQIIYKADTALQYVKRASSRFLTNISNASGDNHVAIVSYQNTATVVSDFSTDYGALQDTINGLSAKSATRSISDGLSAANSLLSSVGDKDAVKNVVLFTTGMTNDGDYTYFGKYDESVVGSEWMRKDTRVALYAYANAAHVQADSIKNNGINLYTIGLFQTMEGMPYEGRRVVALFRLTASDLATSEDYYFPVDDPDKLEFTFGEVADDIVNSPKEITFTYQSGSDYTAKCYYTNDYFSKSSYIYNPSLATMSLSFAMSAFGSSDGGQDDYTNKSKNAKKLLTDIGVPAENIDTNDWFTEKPETDSIGVVSGNMPITVNGEQYTLIALAVRGGGYEREWASNFTIGSSGQHSGFDTAKNNVIEYLKTYVANQNISGPVKFWITGFSRAAATANLVGGALDNGTVISPDISYDLDDIYTYCFEAPAGALTSQVENNTDYNNIFNILNTSDPVPYVAPSALGFGRYGIDKYLPSLAASYDYEYLRSKMLEFYNALSSTDEYVVDDFKMKKIEIKNWLPGGEEISFIQDDNENEISQGAFLNKYITMVAKDFFISRDNYVENFENEIREICSVAFGGTDAQLKIMKDSIVSQAKSDVGKLVALCAFNAYFKTGNTEKDILQTVSNWIQNAVDEAGITDCDKSAIDSAVKNLVPLILALVSNNPDYFATAVVNLHGIGASHYTELCYAWLASMDTNYTNDAQVSFNNGGYRIIRINCDVDVEVYDNNGMIASIKDDKPQEIPGSGYICGIDYDGQKYVFLPINKDYTVKIIGREDGTVNYGISEYCASRQDYTRTINYFDVNLKKNEQLTGIIPSYEQNEIDSDTPSGSNTDYILLNNNNEIIQKNSDLLGDDAINAYYKVKALSSNPYYGIVMGGSSYTYGEFSQVEAYPAEGYKFDGWYKNNKLISSENPYRMRVTEDMEITGVFSPISDDSCEHLNTTLKNQKDATCTVDGYTGDLVCNDCGKTVEKGTVISAEGHKFENGKCSVCGIDEPKQTVQNNIKSEKSADNKINTSPHKNKTANNNVYTLKSGDTTNVTLWFSVLFASIFILIIFVYIKHKKRINNYK